MGQQPKQWSTWTASPPEIGGWLLALCLILTFIYPATSLFHIFSHTIRTLIGARASPRVVLLSVYALLFASVAILSFLAGLRLWLVRPNAVRFAKKYLLIYWIANVAYFVFWLVLLRPAREIAFAEMGWYHIVGPTLPAAMWYLYLEYSKRVRATYSAP